MAIYNVKFITPNGEFTIQCPDDVYILDAAEEMQLDPFSGKGKWVIIDIEQFSLKNALIWVTQRLAHLDKGKFPGERELWHTERIVTLEWVKESDPRNGFHTRDEHIYGDTRIITQTYLPQLLRDGSYRMRWEPDILSELH